MPDHAADPRESLRYVYDMLEQLKIVSGESGSPLLAYLIDMASMEAASEIARRGGTVSRKQRDTSV